MFDLDDVLDCFDFCEEERKTLEQKRVYTCPFCWMKWKRSELTDDKSCPACGNIVDAEVEM